MRRRKKFFMRWPDKKCIVLSVAIFLLTILFIIPQASAQGSPPTKLIKHEPVLKQIKPGTMKVNKLAPVQFKRFTFQELRHPLTKAPIASDEIITLNKGQCQHGKCTGKGRQIKAQDLLNEINRLEQEYNKHGYSLRRTDRRPIVINETIMKRDLLNSQYSKMKLEYRPKDLARAKIYDFAAMRAAHVNRLNQTALIRKNVQNVQQSLVTSLNTEPVKPVIESYDKSWGDRDYFAAGIHGKLQVSADKDSMKTSAEGWAIATVFDHDWKVVSIEGLAEGPTGKSEGEMHASLRVTALGDDLFTPIDKRGPAPLPVIEDDQSVGVDESIKIPVVELGPFSIDVTLGFRGKAGIRYGMYLSPDSIQAKFMPYIETQAYGQAGLNVWLIVDFEAGVGAELTLLNDYLELGTAIGIGFDQPQPYFFWEYWCTNTINTLSGDVYVYLTIDYYIDSDTWKWKVFEWGGFTFDGDVIPRQRFTRALAGGSATAVTPTGTTTGGDDWKVTVFQHKDYGGKSHVYLINPGQCQTLEYRLRNIDMNDMITAARVGNKVNVLLFEHDNYDGKRLNFSSSVPNLVPYKFNDMTSSIIVYPKSMISPLGVWLIGNHQTFYPVPECNKKGSYGMWSHVVHNDDATMVRVPPIDNKDWGNIEVTVWKHADFKGESATFKATYRGGDFYLPKGLKGEVSSLKIVVNGSPEGRGW